MSQADKKLEMAIFTCKVLEAVEALEEGADPNRVCMDGSLPSAYLDNPPLTNCLVAYKETSMFDVQDKFNAQEIFNILIEGREELGVDVDCEGNKYTWTPLQTACRFGLYWAIKALLDAGADAKKRGGAYNITPLEAYDRFWPSWLSPSKEEEKILKDLIEKSGVKI